MSPPGKDETMWAMFCHLSTLLGFVFPFGNIIAPMILWQMKKDEYPLVDDQGKEALNFQISMTIYVLIAVILVLMAIGIVLLIALGLFDLIVTVIAALNAANGQKYRYPLSIRFVK
ncbi:MAG TPA: DUF4870 domain-containing protein [Caldithrix abyssi]|uniref:DUF4870 domain-containing protein n=1 Tax=Caldithrix abyssi TaxID=187145 RepID=A0A7V4WUW9_CALAY|nr:DUF4870 domain-containing protein [Caldithrix abyssi]